MSRRKKGEELDYEFFPFPKQLHPGWADPNCHLLGLCMKLFAIANGGPITVHGDDWLENLCKQMHINGRERPNVRRSLLNLQDAGVVRYTGAGVVSVVFRRTDTLLPVVANPTPVDVESSPIDADLQATCSDPSAVDLPLNIPLEPSVGNDSTHKPQTDRQTDKKDETYIPGANRSDDDAQVHFLRKPESVGYSWLSDTWYTGGGAPDIECWKDDYAKIGRWSVAERATIARHMAETPYLTKKRSKATPGHIVKFKTQFLEGPRTFEDSFPPRPPTKKLGPAPVATREELAEDRRKIAAGEDLW